MDNPHSADIPAVYCHNPSITINGKLFIETAGIPAYILPVSGSSVTIDGRPHLE